MKKILSFKYILFDFIKLITIPPGIIWFRPKILYTSKNAKIKPTGGAMVISNHITFFDPVFLMVPIWYRRFHFIAMQYFFNTKFKNFLFTKIFMCIPIDRDNFSMASFRTIVSHLKNDEFVTMFPEGHINREDNSVSPFKSGMILMAMQSGKPIIPIYIKKRKTIFSRLILAVGDPFYINNDNPIKILNRNEIDRYTTELYNVEENLRKMCENY